MRKTPGETINGYEASAVAAHAMSHVCANYEVQSVEYSGRGHVHTAALETYGPAGKTVMINTP